MRTITINELCGYLAMWVCRQHPYHSVVHVDSANSKLRAKAKESGWKPHELLMKEFSDKSEIESFLYKALPEGSIETHEWNNRKNGNQNPYGFASAFDAPDPDNDFIDIGALFRNVANSAWHGAEE